jgi:hypothetical protein
MKEFESKTIYFQEPGPANTERVLELANQRAKDLGVATTLVASTTGNTAKLAVEKLDAFKEIVIVTHACGFTEPDAQEFPDDIRALVEGKGAKVLTAQHAMGGLNRAIRKSVNTYQIDEIIANTLRIMGQGMKVMLETCMMACDAGLISSKVPVIAIAGTHRGADSAVVIQPANSFNFFELEILEWICLPSKSHPAFHQ